MSVIKYTSIKSVLFNLSLTIDERYWQELNILEWATAALRSMNILPVLEDKVALITLCAHKATLPSDLRFLTQLAYRDTTLPDISLPENTASAYPWKAMRLSASPFALSICLDRSITQCTDCHHTFSISPDLTVTSSAEEGEIMVSYKAFPVHEDGTALIPDDETLKEALLHYVLYRYWMAKFQMKEDGAESRLQFHLSQWSTLSKKAMNLNKPSIAEMDNIMRIWNRLLPRQNRFDQMFLPLTNQENVIFQ